MIDKLLKLDWAGLQKAGFFILSVGLAYTLYRVLTNDLTHINASIEKQNEAIGRQTDVLLKLDSTIGRQSILLETYLRK